MTSREDDLGVRLAAQASRLRLLVAHLAGRAIKKRVDVDDLVQEIFVRALQSRASLPAFEPTEAGATPEPELYGFLAHLARHTVVDVARAMRAQKRAGTLGDQRFATSASSGLRASGIALNATGPFTAAGRRETARDLVAAFERLEPDHRRVLGLRQFEGLSAAETARRMGRSEIAVHSLYRRALAAWALELGGDPSP